jgi:hypothetical protein
MTITPPLVTVMTPSESNDHYTTPSDNYAGNDDHCTA